MNITTVLPELNQEVERAIARLHAHLRASEVLNGTASRQALCEYYRNNFFVVREARALLKQTHEQLRREGAAPALVALFEDKEGEETGHEEWLRDDLKKLGMPLDEAQARHPSRVATLYRDFHRQVIAINGCAFTGTAYMLESLALRCAGAAAEKLQHSGTIPELRPGSEAGLSFFLRHSAEDIAHVEQLGRIIETHLTDEAAQSYALLCARFTGVIYADLF